MDEAQIGVPMRRASPLPFTGISRKRRSFFYTQLARLLSAGIGPVRALGTLADQRGSWRLSRAARDMAAQIQDGATFAEAFARHPNLFPENEVRMIEAAERAGAAPDTMLRIARSLENLRTFWLRFTTGLIIPAITLFVALIVLPILMAIFTGDPVAVMVRQLAYLAVSICLVIALVTGWRSLSSFSGPRVVIQGLLLHVPVFGGVARRMAMARFAEILQCLYVAGVRVPEAMARAAMACGNAAIGQRLLQAVPLVREGVPLSVALAQSGAVPLLGLNMVEVGETAGKLDESLAKFAQYQQEDAQVTVERIAKIGPMVVYLGVVAVMVILIFQAMASYVGAINNLMP